MLTCLAPCIKGALYLHTSKTTVHQYTAIFTGKWYTLFNKVYAFFGTGAEVVYAVIVNVLFTIATIPEIKGYWEKRKSGELKQIESWAEFKTSHPAMGNSRYGEDDTAADAAP